MAKNKMNCAQSESMTMPRAMMTDPERMIDKAKTVGAETEIKTVPETVIPLALGTTTTTLAIHWEKTVKLVFSLIGEEEPTFMVLCAENNYLIEHDANEQDFEHALKILGQVRPTDDPGRIFLTFEASNFHSNHNEGFDATFKAEGSVSLKLGKKTTLATLGDEPLTVLATVEE